MAVKSECVCLSVGNQDNSKSSLRIWLRCSRRIDFCWTLRSDQRRLPLEWYTVTRFTVCRFSCCCYCCWCEYIHGFQCRRGAMWREFPDTSQPPLRALSLSLLSPISHLIAYTSIFLCCPRPRMCGLHACRVGEQRATKWSIRLRWRYIVASCVVPAWLCDRKYVL